jgi:hypothetical protein
MMLPAILFTGCEDIWFDCIEGNHNPVVIEREISTFDEIRSTGPFDVYITKGNTDLLRIDAEENLIPEIKTRIVGEKLYIETESSQCLRNNMPIKIFVSTNHLNEIKLTGSGMIKVDSINESHLSIENTGSGDIEIDYLEADQTDLQLTGSGDIELEGSVHESEMEVMGSGNIRAINLLQNNCEAKITGSGDMYVYVTKYLKATITGSGDIYYKGSPTIDSHITGTGKVRTY